MSISQAVREARTRRARQVRRLKAYGQWKPFVDAQPVRDHVNSLRAEGMSIAGIVKNTGVNSGTIDHLLYGKGAFPPAVKIRTENAEALLAYHPTLDHYDDGAVIDATGTRRRMQALGCQGWDARSIHQHVNHIGPQAVERLRSKRRCTARTARAVRDFYKQVSEQTAEQHGVTPWIAGRTRTYAAKYGWAPPIAWDDIDDPDELPDWTGYCGTDRGYWTHRNQQLPMCARCEQAHQQWADEHAHLTPQERNRAKFRARSQAATREADLAVDARELMRVAGLTVVLAAERLGVTKQHLQQVLLRHPEPAVKTAAAIGAAANAGQQTAA